MIQYLLDFFNINFHENNNYCHFVIELTEIITISENKSSGATFDVIGIFFNHVVR